jgi:hypothetical protein
MILPTKRLQANRSLMVIGAELLQLLDEPKTVSRLWSAYRLRAEHQEPRDVIPFRWFVLALDFLYAVGAVDTYKQELRKRSSAAPRL